MEKSAVLQLVRTALAERFRTLARASESTRDSANDEETRAEGKYDTRGTEAGYLADGQAREAEKAADALKAFDVLLENIESTAPTPTIAIGSLVLLELGSGADWFLLAPAGGGLTVTTEVGEVVTLVTPATPLGEQLLERTEGAEVARPAGRVQKVL